MMGKSQDRIVELATELVRLRGERLAAALNGRSCLARAQEGQPLQMVSRALIRNTGRQFVCQLKQLRSRILIRRREAQREDQVVGEISAAILLLSLAKLGAERAIAGHVSFV